MISNQIYSTQLLDYVQYLEFRVSDNLEIEKQNLSNAVFKITTLGSSWMLFSRKCKEKTLWNEHNSILKQLTNFKYSQHYILSINRKEQTARKLHVPSYSWQRRDLELSEKLTSVNIMSYITQIGEPMRSVEPPNYFKDQEKLFQII